MSIKSRKSPVVRPPATFADARALGLVLAALPGMAFAAQSEPTEGERVLRGVVVAEEVEDSYKADTASSPKFTAPLLDTPQTVTVLKKELLEDQAAGSLAEALRNTPGITFTLGENGNTTAGDSITMRGFDTSNSIFLDGVRDLGAVSRDVFNTEQIEIVKGPSGSDNGRGAPTGYINMSSKQPTLENAISGTLTGGTAARRRVTGDINFVLPGLEGAALRFNTMYDAGDKVGRDVAGSERWAFAPSFALGLGGSTRAYFNYLFTKQSNTPDGGIPAIGLFDYSSATTSGNPPNQVSISPLIIDAINNAEPVDRDNFYGSKDDYERVKANMLTARLEHDLSASTTLRNTSRYGRYTLLRTITGINAITVHTGAINNPTAVLPPSAWTVSRSRQLRDEANEILTNQTNLTSAFNTGFIEHSLSAGFELIYESQLTHGSTSVGTTTAANLYNPSTADSFAVLVPSAAATDGKTLTGAVYAFDTLKFSDHWSFNFGLRHDSYRTDYSSVPVPVTAPATPGASQHYEGSGTLLTGKVGLVFKPWENASIYAAYATSQQPPGGANFTLAAGNAASANNPNLDPQKATNVELGTKWDLLDNRLVLTAAVFDTRNKNDLAQIPDGTTDIVQYGERKVRGIELSASGMITTAWQVTAGFSSMDAKVVEGTATTTGAQLTFTPKLSFTSWTTYKFPFGLTIGGGGRYTDSQFRNGNNTQATTSNLAVNPDSWVFDAMAGYDINEKVGLQLNVQNVTDKFYLSSVNNGGSRFVLGQPRTVLLNAHFKY